MKKKLLVLGLSMAGVLMLSNTAFANGKEIMSAGGIRKVQEHTRRGDGAI